MMIEKEVFSDLAIAPGEYLEEVLEELAMSKQELNQFLLDKTKGTKAEKFLQSNPKVLRILTEVFHDKDAIPAMVSLINKPEKVRNYGIAVIVLMVVVFLLNLKNSKRNLLSRIFFNLL